MLISWAHVSMILLMIVGMLAYNVSVLIGHSQLRGDMFVAWLSIFSQGIMLGSMVRIREKGNGGV